MLDARPAQHVVDAYTIIPGTPGVADLSLSTRVNVHHRAETHRAEKIGALSDPVLRIPVTILHGVDTLPTLPSCYR